MKNFMILVLCLGVFFAVCETDSWGACGGVTTAGNVQGGNSNWTHIGKVNKGAVLRVAASGKVDFGCMACRCVDGPTAGVEGKTKLLVKIFDTFKQQTDIAMTLNPIEQNKKILDALKSNFGQTHQPNFDQGGVWIKVVKKNGTPYLATQLFYFWDHEGGINKYGLPINEDVDVYAKAHDGGKSPDATKGYGDNKGAYSVAVYCGEPEPHSGGHSLFSSEGMKERAADFKKRQAACTSPGAGASPSGTAKRLDFKSCTGCTAACTTGNTCIYANGKCVLSCQ